MMPRRFILSCLAALLAAVTGAHAQWQSPVLDELDDSLHFESANRYVTLDFSGTFDLETYYVDQRPPGLIIDNDKFFFNPRLTLYGDLKIGSHLYAMTQFRADRGFDPGADRPGDGRFDEYLLRYTPFHEPWVNLQIGQFATVFGNWVARHDSWNNPFITAPAPYENVTVITDEIIPASPAAFLGRKKLADKKDDWVPVIWGPAYTTGASLFGRVEKFDYAFEFKNSALSSRPYAWNPQEVGWAYPTVSGRIGFRPNASWNFGWSFSQGAYLEPGVDKLLPAGKNIGDFPQTTSGFDASWAWRHWQVWSEVILSRFDVPNVGNADSLSYFVEAKYKFTPEFYGALRWNQQYFGEVKDGLGGHKPWDDDLWRADVALGWRINRHLQSKLQYSYSHEKGVLQQGEQLVAAQFTIKF